MHNDGNDCWAVLSLFAGLNSELGNTQRAELSCWAGRNLWPVSWKIVSVGHMQTVIFKRLVNFLGLRGFL